MDGRTKIQAVIYQCNVEPATNRRARPGHRERIAAQVVGEVRLVRDKQRVVREKERGPRHGECQVEVGGEFAHICDSAQSKRERQAGTVLLPRRDASDSIDTLLQMQVVVFEQLFG